MWPFATMGWTEEGMDAPQMRDAYPTQVLSTARDIMGLWVARMVMASMYCCDETIPFDDVIIHPTVMAADGKPMSKSRGNGVDPLRLMKDYGADGMRFGLLMQVTGAQDLKFNEAKLESSRNFANKVKNASRFVLMNLEGYEPGAPEPTTPADRWIFSRLAKIVAAVDAAYDNFEFGEITRELYSFVWNEFCDWYLELIKPDMKEEGPRKAEAQYVLWTALREFLILMHPIMPFVTAEIWQALPGGAGSDAAVQLLPEARPGCLKPEAAARMEFVQEVIGMIRTIRAELNIAPSYRLTVLLRPSDAHQKDVLEANREVILTLARLGELIIDADGEAPKASASHVAQGCEVIVHLSGAVDFAAELARLEKELGKIDKELGGLNQKLANEGFVSRAPAEIVERERARVAELTDARVKLTALQQRFRDVM